MQLVKLKLLVRIEFPRSVHELGTVNVDRLQCENAKNPIFVRFSLTVNLFKDVQL